MSNPAALSALAKGDMENFRAASTPGGIEAQEKAGQESLLQTTDMPKELRPNRASFEKIGFKFGEDTDELFVSATLPQGWAREGSDHSMWTYIKDNQGRRRVAVFYKAAFYDRKAAASLEGRYHYGRDYSAPDDAPVPVGVFDCGKIIFKAGDAPRKYDPEIERDLEAKAQTWIEENYPDWADPTAYW